jgi:hypothetical protein
MALKIIIRMVIIIMPGQCCYVMWMIKKRFFEASYWPHRKRELFSDCLNEKKMVCCSDIRCTCPCCVHLKEVLLFYRITRRMSMKDCAIVHDQMLVPFLENFNLLIPSLFPLCWVWDPPPRPPQEEEQQRIDSPSSLRVEYYRMCLLVSDWKKEFISAKGNVFIDASGLFCSLKCKGENLLCWLAGRRRWRRNNNNNNAFISVDILVFRMRMQAKQINGVDVVYSRLYAEVVAALGFMRSPLSVDAMCQFARDIGAVDRMRELAIAFKDKFTALQSFRVVRYMSELVTTLDNMQLVEDGRLIAVAMSLHPRLGGCSLLACVGPDIIPRCVYRTIYAPLCGFRNVLGKTDVQTVG